MTEQPDQPAAQPERERAISERAYAIWHEEGRPEGKNLEHWLRAEREHAGHGGAASPPGQAPGRPRTAAPRRAKAGAGVQRAPAAGRKTGSAGPESPP